MTTATLLRFADSPDGVFGILHLMNDKGESLVLATVEDDWLNNAARISAIPVGRYTCVRRMYNKGGYLTFHITGIPDRDLCLFHIANSEEDVEGCVGLGLDFAAVTVADEDRPGHPTRLKWAVSGSKLAHRKFMDFLADVESFEVGIRWSQPGEWRSLWAA